MQNFVKAVYCKMVYKIVILFIVNTPTAGECRELLWESMNPINMARTCSIFVSDRLLSDITNV